MNLKESRPLFIKEKNHIPNFNASLPAFLTITQKDKLGVHVVQQLFVFMKTCGQKESHM